MNSLEAKNYGLIDEVMGDVSDLVQINRNMPEVFIGKNILNTI